VDEANGANRPNGADRVRLLAGFSDMDAVVDAGGKNVNAYSTHGTSPQARAHNTVIVSGAERSRTISQNQYGSQIHARLEKTPRRPPD
jgi:hypothetical protein